MYQAFDAQTVYLCVLTTTVAPLTYTVPIDDIHGPCGLIAASDVKRAFLLLRTVLYPLVPNDIHSTFIIVVVVY